MILPTTSSKRGKTAPLVLFLPAAIPAALSSRAFQSQQDRPSRTVSSGRHSSRAFQSRIPGCILIQSKALICVKAFGSHWTTQLAQITTPGGAKATVEVNLKVWDSFASGHTPTLDFQRWLSEVFMLGDDPKTVKCSVEIMNSMQQLNYDDCGIIALNNAIAIYNGQADTEMFSKECSRQERYRFYYMIVQHAKKAYKDRMVE
ncbi:hypothetical protein BGAL_1092g00010 [Botrytis galanthina]|uniref:Ubiquitin-like protease family profile domain-containing protein n=1 Tax=Botrytis galanthina TaxID=278940 RepID=A0A4S8QIU1_9HELO|nr:hypothetical protein BGAL_1092g00010 [Botrytis galanthina]